jgi:hypothetical protein
MTVANGHARVRQSKWGPGEERLNGLRRRAAIARGRRTWPDETNHGRASTERPALAVAPTRRSGDWGGCHGRLTGRTAWHGLTVEW